MKYKYELAGLEYHEDINSKVYMHVGFLLHNLNTGEIFFKSVLEDSLLKAFDNKVDMKLVKDYINGIEVNIKHTEYEYFSITEFIKLGTEKLKFGDVYTWEDLDNTEDMINYLVEGMKISNEVLIKLMKGKY